VEIASFKSAVDVDELLGGLAITSDDENGDNSLNVDTTDDGDEEFCVDFTCCNVELEIKIKRVAKIEYIVFSACEREAEAINYKNLFLCRVRA
jgi:ligand-binding sensor protein